MKRLWILLIALSLLAGMLTALACGGDDDDDDDDNDDNDDSGGDDDAGDDDTGDDDSGDDDDTGDDDDATGDVQVANLTVGACGETNPDRTAIPTDAVEARWQGGVLTIWRHSAVVNSEVDLTVTAELAGGVLTISETDAGAVSSMCTADVSYDITSLPGADIDVVIQYENTAKSASDVATFTAETGGDDFEWRIPDLQFISQKEPDYFANQPIALRVNACHLEDPNLIDDDPLKLQIYRSVFDGDVQVYTLDRRNLTDPGVISDECAMIDYDMPGLPAGTYDLNGLGYDYDASELTVSTAELVVQ